MLGLPDEFKLGMDPFVALGAAAEATSQLQLGTAITLVTERDPIVTAKQVASVDVLSSGRMNFGIGPGWINQEMRNHGVNPDDRWAVMRERTEAMRLIWTQDPASYRGDFVSFELITSWPKPVQQPHPPILVAGNGPNVASRVVAYGDEWIPMVRPGVLRQITAFKREARKPGSDHPLPVTLFGGEPEEADSYSRAGVDRTLFWIRPLPYPDIVTLLDRTVRLLGTRLKD